MRSNQTSLSAHYPPAATPTRNEAQRPRTGSADADVWNGPDVNREAGRARGSGRFSLPGDVPHNLRAGMSIIQRANCASGRHHYSRSICLGHVDKGQPQRN